MKSLASFLRDESGAVTIDWVTLTAGVLLAGLVVVFAIFLVGASPAVDTMNGTLSGLTFDLDPGTPPSISGN